MLPVQLGQGALRYRETRLSPTLRKVRLPWQEQGHHQGGAAFPQALRPQVPVYFFHRLLGQDKQQALGVFLFPGREERIQHSLNHQLADSLPAAEPTHAVCDHGQKAMGGD